MSGFDVLGPSGPIKPFEGRGIRPRDDTIGPGASEQGGDSFVGALSDALMEVRELQLDARDKAREMAAGGPVEVHDLMVSMGRSEVAFNLMLEVRNKLLEAWQQLRRAVS